MPVDCTTGLALDDWLAQPGPFEFGSFRLDMTSRIVSRDGESLKLTPKQFEVLAYLVRNPGRVVEKDELLSAVWPGQTVEEGNLTQVIFLLRRALANDDERKYIVTAPRQGYRFAAEVRRALPEANLAAVEASPSALQPLPTREFRARLRGRWGIVAAALLLLPIWALVQYAAPLPHGFHPPPNSIAVLAFSNAGGNSGQAYLSDGVSEQLIDCLARIPGIAVTGRSSSFAFKGRAANAEDVARRLNVATVLNGSVRRDGAVLRIDVQLIDGNTGSRIWAHSYDDSQADLPTIEGEIADAVAASLSILPADRQLFRLTLGGSRVPQAVDQELHALYSLQAGNFPAAIASFNAAVALDQNYAGAHAGRAWALTTVASFQARSDRLATKQLYDDARRSADRAVAIAPDWGEGHAVRALVMEQGFLDFRSAAAESARALTLSPGSAWVRTQAAWLAVQLGHPAEGAEQAKQAAALDPLSPFTYAMLANILYNARRYDEALDALGHARALRPAPTPREEDTLGAIQLIKGEPRSAMQTCSGKRDDIQIECLAIALHEIGDWTGAAAQLSALQASMGEHGAFAYAEIFARWGEPEQALHWLEAAYAAGNQDIGLVRCDPMLDSLRASARFGTIEKRLAGY